MDELSTLITCKKCGQLKPPYPGSTYICVDCAHAEDNRYMYFRQHQGDWIAEAKEQGIPVWKQQPGETQWEYTIWSAYRDSYPGKKPTYTGVAEQLATTYNVVRKAAQRWSFPARMQLWMAECDRVTLLQRRDEILNMNQEHISMAAKLRAKMNAAIDAIDPLALKPNELASLMKMSAELERKARLDTITQDELRKEHIVDDANPVLKKQQTKQSDLREVLEILTKAGALGSPTTVGVKETTTREVIVRNDTTGEEAVMTQDED